jgi:hypothetical protein
MTGIGDTTRRIIAQRLTSGMGQSRRFDCLPPTSALPPSTDIVSSARQVRFVPQLMHCSKRRCYSIISAARIADRPSSLDIGSHSFSCLKLAFLIPIQGRPSQSFIYYRRCGRINYQSGGPAPSSIFRQLSYGKLFEDFFAFSLE